MIKVSFVGNSNTGKTTIIKELLHLYGKNLPTTGVNLQTYYSPSKIFYNISDWGGNPSYKGLEDYAHSNCALFILFTKR